MMTHIKEVKKFVTPEIINKSCDIADALSKEVTIDKPVTRWIDYIVVALIISCVACLISFLQDLSWIKGQIFLSALCCLFFVVMARQFFKEAFKYKTVACSIISLQMAGEELVDKLMKDLHDNIPHKDEVNEDSNNVH